MFFRGALFRRDWHDGCTLLTLQTPLNDHAVLPPSGVVTLTESVFLGFRIPVASRRRQRPVLRACSDRDPFDLTRATFPGPGPERRARARLQPGSCRSSNFTLALGKRLRQLPQPTRHNPAEDDDVLPAKARTQRTRAGSRERVIYVRRLLGNRIWSLGDGSDPLHLRRHPLLQAKRVAQDVERHCR